MNKIEKLKLSHLTIDWLSREITDVEHIIKKLKTPEKMTKEDHELYDSTDLDYLEIKLFELNQRSVFEAKNLKNLRMG
jgi:hypothetical protein